LIPRWLVGLIAAVVLGFALGGSFVWGFLYVPPEQHAAHSEQPHGSAAQKEHKNDFWEKASDDPVAYFTLWLVAFTGVLAVSTGGLWIATIGLYRAGERQIAVAKESADAAQRAALTGERALIVVERAFIMISDLAVNTIGQHGTIIDYRINFNLANSGKTPAKNYTCVANLVVFEGGMPTGFRFPDRTHQDLPEKGTTIGPQARTYFHIDFFIQDAIDVYEGRKKAFVYGWLEYDDIFPDSARHRTEFCMWIEVYADPRQTPQVIYGKAPPILTVRAHNHYNGYDDDCMYRPGQTPVAEEGELPPLTQPLVIQPPSGFQPTPSFAPMAAQFQHGAPPTGDAE
jgi:hypothetical protein